MKEYSNYAYTAGNHNIFTKIWKVYFDEKRNELKNSQAKEAQYLLFILILMQ